MQGALLARRGGGCIAALAACSFCLALPASGRSGGTPISEPGLIGRRDILFFCDFEGNWARHFSSGTRRAYKEDGRLWTTADPKFVFNGRQSARSFHQKGEHGGGGATYYLGDGFTEIHQRVYLYFPEGFEIKPANGIKLIWFWAYQPGKEYGGGGAGTRPTGKDKFSCHIIIERNWTLAFYCYHLDQRGGYGDTVRFRLNGGARIRPGEWNCIELGVKVNDVGQKNGELKGWLNGVLKGEMKNLRLRAAEPLQIRRSSMTMYFGGAGAVNASPKDQYAYYDNYVIARNYIGPAVLRRPEPVRKPSERIVFKPKERRDPLKSFAEALAPVRQKARAADFAGALAGCDELIKASEGKEGADILAAYRSGLAAGGELKKLVIAGAAKKRPTVYMDFGGRAMRMKLIGADELGGEFEMRGTSMPIRWRQVSPRRFYGIASKFCADTPAGHLMLGRYCAAMGLADEARIELDKAAASVELREDADSARILIP